ncbi:hypothetical protein HXP36_18795 [Ralstonia solanacearum]|nr:hypothetical protein [Ralstonia solanacearum]MBB6583782.1 hypothetical protein [Ralstonia solanacearum]
MSFRTELEVSVRESFGDYRGDEHGIEFLDGTRESWRVGRMVDFIEGGGPTPLVLSAGALAYLAAKLAK